MLRSRWLPHVLAVLAVICLGVVIVAYFGFGRTGGGIQIGDPNHGDPQPKQILLTRGFAGTPPPVACAAPSDVFRFEAVLVSPPQSVGITPADVRAMIATANGYVNETAGTRGARLKFLCDASGQPAVRTITTGAPVADFNAAQAVLAANGLTVADTHYATVVNGYASAGYAGIANIGDERGGTAYAFVFGYPQGEILLHEMTHTLSAVQGTEHDPEAPHSTWAGHCFDGLDIECYNDGGARGAQTRPCFSTVWDCGKDDYANPDPPAGSYLATKPQFNLLSCLDKYIVVGLCAGSPPPTTTTTTTPPPTSTTPPPPTGLPAPAGYRVTIKSCTSLGIAWNAVAGAATYVVQRRRAEDGDTWAYLGRWVYPRWNSSWSLNGTYTYRSAGVDSAGRQGEYGQIVVSRAC